MQTERSHLIAYLNAHRPQGPEPLPWNPVVTLSRQRGAGGSIIAHQAAALLGQRGDKKPWIVMDDVLARRVVEDHDLPKQIAQFLDEKQTALVTDLIEELVGLHPSRWSLVEHMAQTILHLSHIGHVIFVGRGAHVVTAGSPQAYHVRIIGSLEKRIERVMEARHFSYPDAQRHVEQTDYDRSKFVAKYFHHRIGDPRGYHLIINTDRVSFDGAAKLITELVLDSYAAAATTTGLQGMLS